MPFTVADGLPAHVDLAVSLAPGWTIIANDPQWPHITVMHTDWSDDAGRWVPIPDGKARLIVFRQEKDGTVRHPELDRTLHPDTRTAMQAVWDAGLLAVTLFPQP